MMTSNDVRNKKFEKAAFGYKQEEMDEFLAQLETELDEMEKERDEANNKIQILADKVREYMRDEDALKDALLMAQKQGHQVIDEANAKAEQIIAEAQAKAAALEDEAVRQHSELMEKNKADIIKEKDELKIAHQQVADFKRQLLDLYKEHLALISTIPDEVEEEAEETVAPVEEVTAEETAPAAETEAAPEGAKTAEEFLAEAAEKVNTLTETPADAVAAFAAEENVD